MSTESPQQIKANYVRLMGAQTGEAFAELMQGAAQLHLKWKAGRPSQSLADDAQATFI
jgi:hypothetical protein